MRTFLRSLSLVAAAALGLVAAQEPSKSQGPTASERLEELIERANELESFRAVYKISTPDKGESEMQLCYSKPDRVVVRHTEREAGIEVSIRGPHMRMIVRNSEQGTTFVDVNCLAIPQDLVDGMLDAVREQFPGISFPEPAEEIRPNLEILAELREDGKPGLTYEVTTVIGEGTMFGWLLHLQKAGKFVEESPETLVFEGEQHSTYVLQKGSGFIESLRVPTDDGDKTMQLVELELAPTLQDGEFELSEPESVARDESWDAQTQLIWNESKWMRGTIAWALIQQVEQGALEWNDATKARASKAHGAHHAALIGFLFSDWIEQWRSGIREFSWWYQSARAQAGEDAGVLAGIERKVEEQAKGLRESIDKSRQAYRNRALQPLGPKDSELAMELTQIDAEACEDASTEHIERALLDEFERQIALAREGKLTDPSEGKSLVPPVR